MDRNDPEFRAAMDRAAVAAEWLLERKNSDAAQEFALDVLLGFCTGFGDEEVLPRALAWAFVLTERRTDLKLHEERLLEDAWQRVRDNAIQDEWDRLGGWQG